MKNYRICLNGKYLNANYPFHGYYSKDSWSDRFIDAVHFAGFQKAAMHYNFCKNNILLHMKDQGKSQEEINLKCDALKIQEHDQQSDIWHDFDLSFG
jgi:hypothetical protein